MPVEGIRAQTRRAARHWIWLLSQVPLVAMIITAFGVLNVMLASVRARRWEMGVLRSLGFTRATIIRTIIAEGLLIGVVAGCLSFSFGLLSGWCGAGFAQYISFFGGLHPERIVPWLPIGIGLAMLVGLAGATAIWPAVDIGRIRPLALLQRGRSAF